MFFNILIILYLLILNELHSCSGEKSKCSSVSYPVTADWIFESDTLPPANLIQNLTVYDNGTVILYLFINDQREDFTVTILANPFVKNGSAYPPELNTSDFNLRQFYMTCKVCKVNELTKLYYERIITGWYYFVITNKNGTRWKYESKFYETNYPFIDMRIQLEGKGEFKPETIEAPMSYHVNLRVPLDCIVARVNIYELKEKVDDAFDHIKQGRIQETQSCWIQNIGEKASAHCELNSQIILKVTSERMVTNDTYNNTWIVHMIWKNLTRGGGYYYLDYSNPNCKKCDQKFGAGAVEAWRPIEEEPIYLDLGEHREKDIIQQSVTKKNFTQPEDWLWITCFLVVSILVIILCYWVLRWRGLMDLLKEKEKPRGIPKEPSKSVNDKESNQILLIYVKGCPRFEKEVEDLKKRLETCCSAYKIRDVYAPSEFKYVEDVKKWVDEILKAGSKVIWFDTPQLRSRLNFQDEDCTWNDFRDEAVPYTLELARELHQDTHSQYCYHFVVQMEDFKVEKDQDDPLQSFTPHTRWLLPGHFSDLCEKLNGQLIEPPQKHQNLYTEITFDFSSYNRLTA